MCKIPTKLRPVSTKQLLCSFHSKCLISKPLLYQFISAVVADYPTACWTVHFDGEHNGLGFSAEDLPICGLFVQPSLTFSTWREGKGFQKGTCFTNIDLIRATSLKEVTLT